MTQNSVERTPPLTIEDKLNPRFAVVLDVVKSFFDDSGKMRQDAIGRFDTASWSGVDAGITDLSGSTTELTRFGLKLKIIPINNSALYYDGLRSNIDFVVYFKDKSFSGVVTVNIKNGEVTKAAFYLYASGFSYATRDFPSVKSARFEAGAPQKSERLQLKQVVLMGKVFSFEKLFQQQRVTIDQRHEANFPYKLIGDTSKHGGEKFPVEYIYDPSEFDF